MPPAKRGPRSAFAGDGNSRSGTVASKTNARNGLNTATTVPLGARDAPAPDLAEADSGDPGREHQWPPRTTSLRHATLRLRCPKLTRACPPPGGGNPSNDPGEA